MQVKSTSKYLKMSPKKMRLVANAIMGMDVSQALDYLEFIPKRAAPLILRTIKSAVADAEHNFSLKKDNLIIKEVLVNSGPTLKRWRARAFGRAAQIRKRSSHLSVILQEKEPTQDVKLKEPKLKEPVVEPVTKKQEPSTQVVPKKTRPEPKKIVEPEPRKIFDITRKGKRRAKQHLDKVRTKKGARGGLKQIFRRKSI